MDAATDLGYPTQDVVNAFAAVDVIVGVPLLASSLNVIKILMHPTRTSYACSIWSAMGSPYWQMSMPEAPDPSRESW